MRCPSLFVLSLALALDVVAAAVAVKPSINSTVEQAIETACKVCPWDKCINKKVYPFYDEGTNQYYNNVTLSCWTHGEHFGGADGNK